MDSLPAEPPRKPKNTGAGSLSLLQRIFPTQELNRGLLNCRQILYQLSYQESHYNNLARGKYATMLIAFTLKFINHNYSSACIITQKSYYFPLVHMGSLPPRQLFHTCFDHLAPHHSPSPTSYDNIASVWGQNFPRPHHLYPHPSVPKPVHPAFLHFYRWPVHIFFKAGPFLCILSTLSYSVALPFPPLSASGVPLTIPTAYNQAVISLILRNKI